MTYIEALEFAIENIENQEVKEKLEQLLAAQVKKAVNRKPRVNKAKLELADQVAAIMEPGTDYRANDLAKMLDVATQRVTPALGFLVEAGQVGRRMEKRVALYTLVTDEDVVD